MTDALRIALAQINPVVGDIPYNTEKIRKIRDGVARGADLIVFPEMALCGYPPEDLILKPLFLEKIQATLRALAAESRGRTELMIVPAPIRSGGKTYNAAHLIGYGKIITSNLKHHLPNYGVFDEARVFASGPLPTPIEIGTHKVGLMICEDMWHADIAAYLKKMGADLLISVNASPYETDKLQRRKSHAAQRVADTGLPIVYLNMVGGQDELVFDGASFLLDSDGQTLWQAPSFTESCYTLSLEKKAGQGWTLAGSHSVAQDPTQEESAIYEALCLGLRDYVEKNGFPGVLLGLSGGIDSALVAAIAADALGPERVRAVMMPSAWTSPESLRDAQSVAAALGIRLDSVSIELPVKAFEALLRPHIGPDAPPVTHENIQPRCRGLILMALSNASGSLVLSTGNKSEMAVGYATLYGDMCGGFNPLKDVYKTQVYALARWRNENRPACAPKIGSRAGSKRVISDHILTKPPTAELKPDQTDQDTLPPYDILDGILACLIEEDLGPEETAARGFDIDTVEKVLKMLDNAEYKRRQAPPGTKITARAFGRDRRYPITNRFRI